MTPDQIATELARFVAPDQYTELRAKDVGARGRVFAGWFDGRHLKDMARHALNLTRQASAVYFIPSPISPDLAAKRLNRVLDVHRGFELTKDTHVLERRFLIVDLDPRRMWFECGPAFSAIPDNDQDAPSSARELGFARRISRRYLIPFLTDLGFGRPIEMCSGNGIHLVYRIAPIRGGQSGNVDPLASILRILDERFSCYGVRIDPGTFNPCRMLKVPGTFARKGDATRFRPHRLARVLTVPNDWRSPEPVGVSVSPADAPGAVADVGTGASSGPGPERGRTSQPARSGVGKSTAKPAATGTKPTGGKPKPAGLFDAGGRGSPSSQMPD